MRLLIAIPAYNEAASIGAVLRDLACHRIRVQSRVLVIDDASTDDTNRIATAARVDVLHHADNRGYGSSLIDAFAIAARDRFDWVITMDADGQHEASWIPAFIEQMRANDADVLSGSRYLSIAPCPIEAPPDRRRINRLLTLEINQRLSGSFGTMLTDAFCGFKAYRVSRLRGLKLTEPGYAFPMQFWVRAAASGLRVRELPVRRIYTGAIRSFGPELDDPVRRLAIYRGVMHRELRRCRAMLPPRALMGLHSLGSAQSLLDDEPGQSHESDEVCVDLGSARADYLLASDAKAN